MSDGEIEVWGDGKQTRSFLYIDECIEGIRRLMDSEFTEPVNIGSEEMVTINKLAKMVIKMSGKKINIKNIEVPQIGVKGRNSNNDLFFKNVGWKPSEKLISGLEKTFNWIEKQVKNA